MLDDNNHISNKARIEKLNRTTIKELEILVNDKNIHKETIM